MKPIRTRLLAFSLVVLVMFGAVYYRLVELTVIWTDDLTAQAEAMSVKTIAITGMRGKILDANMIPLAHDIKCYNIQFYRDPTRTSSAHRQEYTRAIIEAIRIIEGNGKRTIGGFWLERDEDGQWRFNTGAATPEVNESRIKRWRSNFVIGSSVPVEDLFDRLCANYMIPAGMDEAHKIKVLAIWQEQRMNNYLSEPISIAYDVGFQTMAEIEARSSILPGISVTESYARVYPQRTLAAHTIGYTGRIPSDAAMADYIAKGYGMNTYVGLTGIEASMEDQLTPNIEYRQGRRTVEINRNGKVIRELSYEPPMNGNSIILTLDAQLQSVAERALEAVIRKINEEQQNLIRSTAWQKNNRTKLVEYAIKGREVATAETGALIAMDPNSGGILAMASYPGFDLSVFEGQIDSNEWKALATDTRNPLLNRAVYTRDTPGSIFKMATALGGLVEGVISLNTMITDLGAFTITDETHPPKCWVSSENRYLHSNMTVIQGLSNSCNYFFYTVGYELTSIRLTKWAAQLGLTSKTGIELNNETTSFVGNQDKLYDPERAINEQYTDKPSFVASMIRQRLKKIGEERGIRYDDQRVERVVKSLLDIAYLDVARKDEEWPILIRDVLLVDMNLPSEYIRNRFLVNEFYSYLNDLKWTPNETILASIGQSITQVTPIAVARYASAIANGGTVYNARLIDKIISPTGEVILDKQPVVANKVEADPSYFAAIHRGMENVTSVENDGTAAAAFKQTKYKIAAKTGTGQRTNVDVENNSWLITYAPVDDPKIVVVVYVQNGYAGARSASAAIEVIEYYLDNLNTRELSLVSAGNTLAD
jgi:penicillin-binding protein 2